MMAGLVIVLLHASCSTRLSASSEAGHVLGQFSFNYDPTEQQFYVSGWACQQGQHASIAVHVYANNPSGDSAQRTFIVAGKADIESETAVNQSCQDQTGKHRFRIALPHELLADGKAIRFYVHGIRVVGNVENTALTGSGEIQEPARWLRTRGPFPPVSGTYTSLSTHPQVFTTQSDLVELAGRIATQGSYSNLRFRQLASQIARDLASTNEWSATYSGCNAGTYQYAFSYEPQDGNITRIRADLGLDSKANAPAGAAVVASRLSLYAALVKAGAPPPAGAPSSDEAAALAKRILLAWSEHGFRDEHGDLRTNPAQFCDDQGKPIQTGVGLIIGRGILYSVYAQDLLMYLGALDAAELRQANEFHAAMYDLLRNSLNTEFAARIAMCDHYNNQSANTVAGLLAVARLLNNKEQFEAALNGGAPGIFVSLPWNALLNGAIYGDADVPNACRPNTGSDGQTSKPFFETPVVAPGEIDDRFRNLHPDQGIAYPMFTLERFFDSAEILRIAGFDGYGYRGRNQQSIEEASRYYACYAKGSGFGNSVTSENAKACPDAAQYVGKVVSGVAPLVTIGAYRFPQDASLKALESAAKQASSSGAFSLDAILFGRWRD
jgi:hypothetical protein